MNALTVNCQITKPVVVEASFAKKNLYINAKFRALFMVLKTLRTRNQILGEKTQIILCLKLLFIKERDVPSPY